ncbi:MAG: DNA recombination protein RmuC [Chthonomonas sp.]|nr:DNA recombination protein RmuC [Chthonomonas sp.]
MPLVIGLGVFVAGGVLVGILVYILLRPRLGQVGELDALKVEKATLVERASAVGPLQEALDRSRAEANELGQKIATLDAEAAARDRQFAEQKQLLADAENRMREAFQNLANTAVQTSQGTFLELAKSEFEKLRGASESDLDKRKVAIEALLKPIEEKLGNFNVVQQDMERARTEAYGELRKSLETVKGDHERLQRETRNLVQALRNPVRRGQWGELQLKRVVEMAGMLEYCDFETQKNLNTDDGRLRPDLIVKLPNNRTVVVDAKTPLDAYLSSVDAEEEDARRTMLVEHARQVKKHVEQLSAKSYDKQFESSPEFVVLFLPGESLYSAALEQDPSLIEFGVNNNVLIATPTTLIALLRSVAAGWRQEKLAEEARHITTLGRDLHSAFRVFADHYQNMGKKLTQAVDAYNDSVGSLERNILPKARKLKSLGGAQEAAVVDLNDIDISARTIHAPEVSALPASAGLFEEGSDA